MESRHGGTATSKLGELLRRHRQAQNLSQREIARKLHYQSLNFICMIENGASQIPFSKIPEIVAAYKLPPIFLLIIMRERHPEAWQVMSAINIALPEVLTSDKKDVERLLDEVYVTALVDYRIG
jgi:transcriptional regulator with XRE-family HTH domain